MLQPLPLHHVYPLVIGTLVPLALGVTIVLPSSLTGPELIRAIREQDVTIILGVPRLYSALLAGLERQIDEIPVPFRMLTKALIRVCSTLRAASGINAGRLLLRPLHKRIGPRLRVLASGGSPLDPAVARRLEGVGWNVAIGYGLTETSPLLTIRPPGKGTDDTVGRAVRGAELRVDQSVETTGDDDDGEILARGPGVFDGYLNRDDETEASFTDDGWFRTGDLGRLDSDGQLYVLGRKSTMLVSASGENIRTEALEETYAEHPHIGEVGILKDGDRLAAVIYPDPETLGEDSGSAEDAIADAVAECSGKLPSHQRLDRFRITHEPLDRTRLDKIRRQKLEERYESLESESSEHEPEPMAIDEMSPGDRKLLADERTRQVWELMVRRYPGVRLTPDTNFRLALGVDSLGWLDLSTEILRETGIELREDDISKIDTLRDLLEAIADRESAPDNLKAPLEDPDAALSEAQKAWLKPRPRIATATARGLYWLNSLLMRAGFRVRIEGQLPDDDTPLLIAPNHTSFLDPFVLAAALPAHLRTNVFWGGWTGWAYRNPIFRFFSRIARVIPVERERRVVSSLTFAKAALDRNRILVWFPEGERSRDGDLKPLRPGIGALLEHSPDVCVVPVWIAGAFEAWPYGKRMPRLRRISIHFGSGTSPAQLEQAGDGDDSRERLLEGLRSRIRALRPED